MWKIVGGMSRWVWVYVCCQCSRSDKVCQAKHRMELKSFRFNRTNIDIARRLKMGREREKKKEEGHIANGRGKFPLQFKHTLFHRQSISSASPTFIVSRSSVPLLRSLNGIISCDRNCMLEGAPLTMDVV